MKNIFVILALVVLSQNFVSAQGNAGGTLIPTTSVYSGDLTTEKFQEKINIIDAEIEKLEVKRASELEKLEKSYQANMPKAPKNSNKSKTTVVNNTKKEVNKYSLADLYSSESDTTKVVASNITANETKTDDFTQIKADYDSKFEASKDAINTKYDTLIAKFDAQKLTITEMMVNSKGNYIASTTSANKAGNLYATIKYADNLNSGTVTTTNGNVANPNGGQVVMLYVHNELTSCTVTITSAPFTGITLSPGQKSTVALPVSCGVYALAYTEYRNGTSIVRNRTMNIGIPADTKFTDLNIFENSRLN